MAEVSGGLGVVGGPGVRVGGLSDEGDDNKLQADQRAGRGADDYVEVFPSGDWCHGSTSGGGQE